MSIKLIFNRLTLHYACGEDPLVELYFLFIVEFLEPDSLSRAKVFLIFFVTLLPPSKAFVEDFDHFGVEDPKTRVDVDDS